MALAGLLIAFGALVVAFVSLVLSRTAQRGQIRLHAEQKKQQIQTPIRPGDLSTRVGGLARCCSTLPGHGPLTERQA